MDDLEDEPIAVTGVRAAESRKRSTYPEWEWWDKADCEQWRPLLRWTDQDVVDIHKRHGVPPNPLYLRGASRVGCWPCIHSRKSEIRNIADTDPERIDLMQQLEEVVTEMVRERQAERGEVSRFDHSGWFWNAQKSIDPDTGKRVGGAWPIRRVVEWAKTKRGGRQYEMFAPPAREWGCMRWGVCDTGAADD